MNLLCLPGGAGETGPAARVRRPHFLHPGQLIASPAPALVTTILGSCVAVCLWDTAAGVGGVNHFILPFGPGGDPAPHRFGGPATRDLIGRLLQLGASRQTLQAKAFGGASTAPGRGAAEALGFRNVARALEVLEAEGIPVTARDTEGSRGRKVLFQTDDGAAWVRAL